jgi:hypothetical protein
MAYEKRLYQILYPNQALVASQYNPNEFARHYSSGSTRYYHGKLLFSSVDIEFRHPYFNIEEELEHVKLHEDGRPKATRFISNYRVLEHIGLNAIGNLYLTTPEGYCLELVKAPIEYPDPEEKLRIFTEISPLRMLVLTQFDFVEFGKNITHPENRKGAPSIIYTQCDFDVDSFLEEFANNPFMIPPIPGLHPSKLREAIMEMKANEYKKTKGLSLDCSFDSFPYKLIRRGFMIASSKEHNFYPMPSGEEIEKKNYKFWKYM